MSSDKKNRSSKTGFSKYMTETFVPNYSNNVMGLVYVGAAILILVVGLRGLGSVASQLPIMPDFALDGATGKIHPNLVMFALILEFFMLILLALVTYFTPVDHASDKGTGAMSNSRINPEEIIHELEYVKKMTDHETKMLEENISKFEQHIENKISEVAKHNKQAISNMKQSLNN